MYLLKYVLIFNAFYVLYFFFKSSNKNNGSYTHKKYKYHILCSIAYNVACVNNKFSKKVVFYRGKNAVYRFIKGILKEYDYCKKMIKKHFVMPEILVSILLL